MRHVKARTRIGLGLHVSLTFGQAQAERRLVPDLVNASGALRLTLGELIARAATPWGRRRLAPQVKAEVEAQFQRLVSLGVQLTHFDGHEHVHVIPGLHDVVAGVASSFGITKCRRVREPLAPYLRVQSLSIRQKTATCVRFAYQKLNMATPRSPLKSPDLFFGFLSASRWTEDLLLVCLKSIPDGATAELAFHPGEPTTADLPYCTPRGNAWLQSPERAHERALLTGTVLRQAVAGCTLIDYGAL